MYTSKHENGCERAFRRFHKNEMHPVPHLYADGGDGSQQAAVGTDRQCMLSSGHFAPEVQGHAAMAGQEFYPVLT